MIYFYFDIRSNRFYVDHDEKMLVKVFPNWTTIKGKLGSKKTVNNFLMTLLGNFGLLMLLGKRS